MSSASDGLAFREVQQFRQVWLWLLLGPTLLMVIGLMVWGMATQLALGHTWGSRPMPDIALAIVGPTVIVLSVLLLYGFLVMKLITEVQEDELLVRFAPFVRRRIRFQDIEQCEALSYNSIAEYGGWGMRWAPGKGWAYNVSGGGGVRLELLEGKRLLIGSQRPEQLADAIRTRMSLD